MTLPFAAPAHADVYPTLFPGPVHFGAPQAASGRTPARLRGSTIAELPITARTRAYGRIETEMKTRRDEPGRALQVGAGAGLSWQVSNQTQLQVEVGTAPGQNRTQVSVMLQLQL